MVDYAQVTRRVEWDAGHRVPAHDSKCKNPHGHRYRLEATVQGAVRAAVGNPDDGMVVDFGALKEVLQKEIVDEWDHAFLVAYYDPLCIVLQREFPAFKIVKLDDPPTAECLARIAFDKVQIPLRKLGLELVRVKLYETPNCWAEVEGLL